MASPETFDLVVIGSGPAGEKGAAQAAYFGKRVALVEKEPWLGGAGVNTGTVPSKTLRETALYFSGLKQRGLYGVDYSIKQDITVPDFMFRKEEVVRNLWAMIAANVDRHKIEVYRGAARFEDPHTIRIEGFDGSQSLLSGDVILIATGSYPNWPDKTPRTRRGSSTATPSLHEPHPRVVGRRRRRRDRLRVRHDVPRNGHPGSLVSGAERLLPSSTRDWRSPEDAGRAAG